MFGNRIDRAKLILALTAVVATIAATPQPGRSVPDPDTVFVGRVLTLDPGNPAAHAVAVANGRITAVGSEADVTRSMKPDVKRIQVSGVMLPGFADAHSHPIGVGEQLERIDLRGRKKQEIVDLVARQASLTAAGEWILGGGWDQGFWTPAQFPVAADLDPVSPDHPVVLTRIDGHSVWLNSAALKRAGIGSDTADPSGGRILRDARGAPTGMLVDKAVDLANRAIPGPTREQIARRMKAAFAQFARWGLTSIHDAGADADEIAIYKDLLARGEITPRAYVMARGTGPTAAQYLARGPEIGLGRGYLTIRSFKVIVDGALGSRGAQLIAPYADEQAVRGLDLMRDPELQALVKSAAARGFQVNAHAIGDRAIRRVLDAYERFAGPPDLLRRRRYRVEHVSVLHDNDVPRFAQLGIIASMQPNFVGEYSRWALDRVGPQRIRTVYRTRDLLRSGAVIATGSDYPASDSGDPIVTLYCMVTRVGAAGEPKGGWQPEQRVDVDTALKSMTWAPAFASFQEDDLGAIAVGRYADFTVLSADPHEVPAERLNKLKVLMTIVGGKIVYREADSSRE